MSSTAVKSRRDRRKTTTKSIVTHNQILEAAVDCFVGLGYHKTNMARIAEAANVTRGCLLYYFSTTEDLLRSASAYIADRQCQRLEQIVRGAPSGVDRFDTILSETIEIVKDRYFIAWLELLACARADETLRPMVDEGIKRLDLTRKRRQRSTLEGHDFDQDLLDLTYDAFSMFLIGSSLYAPPENKAKRTAAVMKAIRSGYLALYGFEDSQSAAEHSG